jgi:hypothetical protein
MLTVLIWLTLFKIILQDLDSTNFCDSGIYFHWKQLSNGTEVQGTVVANHFVLICVSFLFYSLI